MSDWWDEDPGTCADCGEPYELVRPGKSQPTCTCHETCPAHGEGKVVYHPEGEFPQVSGYFCADCLVGGDNVDQRHTLAE